MRIAIVVVVLEVVTFLGCCIQVELRMVVDDRDGLIRVDRILQVGNRVQSMLVEVLHDLLLEGEQIRFASELRGDSLNAIALAFGLAINR